MFNWFKNNSTCKDCRHYYASYSEDKLNEDKTVTRGRLNFEYCGRGGFYLKDTVPCELFDKLGYGERRVTIPIPMPPIRKE